MHNVYCYYGRLGAVQRRGIYTLDDKLDLMLLER